jgi:hypothetical protein
MLEQKQALSALLQFASASVEYEKFQNGLYVRRVNHPPDSHYQREDMHWHHPPLLSVVAQAFHQRLIRLLLTKALRMAAACNWV